MVVLVDVSEAVGTNALEAARELDLSAYGAVTPIIYASDARVVSSFAQVSPAEIRAVRRGEVNLSGALQFARAQGATRILLVSSGIESMGRALDAVPDVPVDVHPVDTVPNAQVVRLLAPAEVSLGETFDALAVVETDRDARLTLRPVVGGEVLEPVQTSVTAGRHSFGFPITADEPGVLPIEVSIEVDFEQPRSDDSQRIEVMVTESERVLVVGDPALAALLEAQNLPVMRGTPDDVVAPLDYAAVAIRGSAADFSPGQLELLADFVHDGGGLLMTGGEDSFGLSGWYRTPVEAVLPVHTELPSDLEIPQVAVVMVIDRSGSMRAESPSRMSLAQRGAIELVEAAHPTDMIGLVVFDDTHEWIFRPRAATERGKREMVHAIRGIRPDGGTIVGPAYREALDALRNMDAAVKHIILLSDGEFFDGTRQGIIPAGPRPDFEAMAAEGLQDGITTTTIGIGEADYTTIQRMAEAGGGRFYGVTRTQDLPQVFTTEVIATPRSLVREGPVQPIVHPHPLLLGTAPPPPVSAYVASVLKDGSEMLLEGVDEEPVVAVGRQGLGRSAALTTDLNQWAGAFGTWPDLPALVTNIVRWLQVRPEPYSTTLDVEGNQVRVVVDAVREGAYLNDERLDARYGGTTVRLEQTGPGRYEGLLPAVAQGGSVVISRGGDVVTRQPASFAPAALNPEGAAERLQALANRSGGEIVDMQSYEPPLALQRITIWPYLAVLGLLLFLFELIRRRFDGLPFGRARLEAT